MSEENIDHDLAVEDKIWNLKTIKFLKYEELEHLNDLSMGSAYASKLLEKGTSFFEKGVLAFRISESLRKSKEKKGYKPHQKKPRSNLWIQFYSGTLVKCIVDFNNFVQNYLDFLQEKKFVNCVRRDFMKKPLNLFPEVEIPLPIINHDSCEKESKEFCNWCLENMASMKFKLAEIGHLLGVLMKTLDEECGKVEKSYGSMDKLILNAADFQEFEAILKGKRTSFFEIVLEGEHDDQRKEEVEEDDDESNPFKRPKVFYQFM
ncbi:uncharacterized protein LOC113284527 [Papaver somniferum]|uniref:uncharacterized protein LOC113284527 n=1 Tax=Papaver somniferum TaxID=3469 RepID=UPI000E6F9434|nr:uncharacterized protein LOC113284527 [Papaver somniferum]